MSIEKTLADRGNNAFGWCAWNPTEGWWNNASRIYATEALALRAIVASTWHKDKKHDLFVIKKLLIKQGWIARRLQVVGL